MGRYDDISDAKLRYEVQRFARILQRMEEKDEVLDRTADILTLLGELRRMVFAWEVRATFRDRESESRESGDRATGPTPVADLDGETDSERIVREAVEQQSDFIGALDDDRDGSTPPSDGAAPDDDGGDDGKAD